MTDPPAPAPGGPGWAAGGAAERVRDLARVARLRNGRLEVDWLSRRLEPRWRMLALDGRWYDRARLRDWLAATGRPPPGRAALSVAERAAALDPEPWALAPRGPRGPRAGNNRGGTA
jgi:hypothetical protein